MFLKRDDPHLLLGGMAAVKMGDRLVQIGCADGDRLAAVCGKVGLSGRALLVAPDEASAERGRRGAARAGVLVDVEMAPPGHLPVGDDEFDIAIVDDTGGLLAAMSSEDRVEAVRELSRVLRPAGRALLIGTGPRSGLAGLLSRGPQGPLFSDAAAIALQTAGFRAVRTLAERDGLSFVEGIKPRRAGETGTAG
jgi:ubiquinone/menaquinone biosynthesis C-methylase UbiE